ncbi:MAG: hypothetical protein V1915_02680 [Candidatus Bathyarchaeota archaeon]
MSQVLELFEKGQTITIFGTVFMALGIISFYVNLPGITEAASTIMTWSLTIGGFAWCLAYYSQNVRYITLIRRRAKVRREDLVIAIIWMIFFWGTFIGGLIPTPPSWFRSFYNWLCLDMGGQYQSAGVALVGFYTFSGAYRAFRFNKSFDYSLAVIVAIFVMMSACPLLGLISPALPPVADWVNVTLAGYGYRGITITIGIGSILLGIRVLLGMDRRIYGVMEKEKRERAGEGGRRV